MGSSGTRTGQPAAIDWDASLYELRHSYVWKYGEDLVDLLAPRSSERILDVGCGTGRLTARIAAACAAVMGIDSSAAMIEQARHNYPGVSFEVADAADLSFPEPFDAVFSNAALHWMKQPGPVAQSLSRVLRPGGRLVAEFGGKGNVRRIVAAVNASFEAVGCVPEGDPSPWYFPSIGEYASLLEAQGLLVTYATLFDRPTPLNEGANGLRQWLQMFGNTFLGVVPPQRQEEFVRHVEDRLRPTLYRDGTWVIDHVRLRIVAFKQA